MSSTFLEYLQSGTKESQERARVLNFLHVTGTLYNLKGETPVDEVVTKYLLCWKVKDILKVAISLRQKFKDLKISKSEIEKGSFFDDNKNFNSDPSSNEVLLWVAHNSEVVSLDPSKPFLTMRTPRSENANGKVEIGRPWPREKIKEVDDKFPGFYNSVSGDQTNFICGTKTLTTRLSSQSFPVTFNSNVCYFNLKTFIATCVCCMVYDTQPSNSFSILNLLGILIPQIVPDVVARYIEWSSRPPTKTEARPEVVEFDVVRYKLEIDYAGLNETELVHNGVVPYIVEEFGKQDKPTTFARATSGDIGKKLEDKMVKHHLHPIEKSVYE